MKGILLKLLVKDNFARRNIPGAGACGYCGRLSQREPCMNAFLRTVLVALAAQLCPGPAAAAFPDKPLKLVVPFPAGGASDTAARALAQVLAKSLGQVIIVENRPGASGAIAAQSVLIAPADGYTLLWASASMVAIPHLQKKPPFRAFTEFAPVSMVGRLTYCMFVPAGVPAASVAEFIKYARANPGKLSYASGSIGEYMASAEFMRATGLDLVQVPYKGGAQAMPDLIAGRVQLNFGPYAGGYPHVKDGKLRMLATVGTTRNPVAPNLPTLTEAGVPGVASPTWQAIFAPPGTPRQIIDRLAGDIAAALADATLREQFSRQAVQPEASTPEALVKVVRDDAEIWKRFIRDNNIPQE
jgi:tripartite-type tricarboxylate transporter receptor subunit TctC